MMNNIATFEKVSFEQYLESRLKLGAQPDEASAIHKEWENIRLPERATNGSAGYDFFLPTGCCFGKHPILIPTGIRCRIDPGWFLMCCPKSGLGFKYKMRLANTIGVVDAKGVGVLKSRKIGEAYGVSYGNTEIPLHHRGL